MTTASEYRCRIALSITLFCVAFIFLIVGKVESYWFWATGQNYHYEDASLFADKEVFTKIIRSLMVVTLILGASCICMSFLMMLGTCYPKAQELQHIAFRVNVALAGLAGLHAIHTCVIFLVDIYALNNPLYQSVPKIVPPELVPGVSFYLVFVGGLVEFVGGYICNSLEAEFTEMVKIADHVDVLADH